MLRPRVGAGLFLKNGIVVQSMGFGRYLPVGRPKIAVEYLNRWGIDEIAVLDIDASREKRSIDPKVVRELSSSCFTPLTVGGGITTLTEIETLLKEGADKICLNHILWKNPQFVTEAAHAFGQQCVVVSADVWMDSGGNPMVYDYFKGQPTSVELMPWLKQIESLGAGEVLVNSVYRDGMRTGFDIGLLEKVAQVTRIPVLAIGGAGTPNHFEELFRKTKVQAGFAGNFFHYTEHSVMIVKAALTQSGISIRTRPEANYYENVTLGFDSRVAKKPDAELDELLFAKLPSETL